MKNEYTLSLFTENHIGILNQITIILTRRQINIESITASESAVPGVHLWTLVVITTPEMVSKVVRQMEKLVDVLKVFVHTSDEIIYQEIAMFKVATRGLMSGNIIDHIVRGHHARILEVTPEYVVIEKTGHKEDTKELFEALRPFNVLEFVRSGRVAMMKEIDNFSDTLHELEKSYQ